MVYTLLGFPGSSDGKASAYNAGDQVLSLGREDLLEKEMATHSSILVWKIPWTEDSGRLQSMASQRVRHDWATSLSLSATAYWRSPEFQLVMPAHYQAWFSSPGFVQSLSRVWLFATPWTACSAPGFPVHHISQSLLKLMSIIQWCHPAISSSVVPFSSCLQSFSAWGSFPVSRLFASSGQSIGASASASVLSVAIQDWFPLGLTGLILLSKGLSRVFSSTIARRHQFFGAQPFLLSCCHIYMWLLEKPWLWFYGPL